MLREEKKKKKKKKTKKKREKKEDKIRPNLAKSEESIKK